jgi:hypothetical protein
MPFGEWHPRCASKSVLSSSLGFSFVQVSSTSYVRPQDFFQANCGSAVSVSLIMRLRRASECRLSSSELVNALLDRIATHDQKLHAFVALYPIPSSLRWAGGAPINTWGHRGIRGTLKHRIHLEARAVAPCSGRGPPRPMRHWNRYRWLGSVAGVVVRHRRSEDDQDSSRRSVKRTLELR